MPPAPMIPNRIVSGMVFLSRKCGCSGVRVFRCRDARYGAGVGHALLFRGGAGQTFLRGPHTRTSCPQSREGFANFANIAKGNLPAERREEQVLRILRILRMVFGGRAW